MKLRMGWVLGLWLCGAFAAVTSCGGRAHVDGTDSNTHWLKDCERDSQCGDLSCICGVCTSACDEARNCAPFGAEAACEVPAGCDSRGPTACVLPRSSGSGGSSGGGGSSGSGTTGGNPGGGSASSVDCAPMDARSNGLECAATVGYTWSGTNCEVVTCGCLGSDCSKIFATADDCDHAHRECYEAKGVSRSCSTHADCMVQDRTCCTACQELGYEGAGNVLIATNVTSPSLRDAGVCLGDPQSGCDPCLAAERITIYSACIEGECRLLDVTANATCESVEDCRLTTRDCCECGGDFSAAGVIAVSRTERHAYCSPQTACLDCLGGAPDRALPVCDTERGLCRVGFIPK